MPLYEALSPQRDISHSNARRHHRRRAFFYPVERPSAVVAWVGLTPSEHSSGESDRRGAITKVGNKHLRKTLVEAAWHYLTCSGRPKDLAKGQAPDRGARRHAAKGVRRLVERREALLARGVHGNKANVATARELACWVWAVGLMAEEA
ncbi:transposase [Collinsella aerofaciens]|nr:transposase [Collinsella aerofaciens]